MATKWKKSKLVKALLVIMTVAMSFTLAFSCVECALLLNSTIYNGTAEELVSLYRNGKPDFFDSPSFYYAAMDQVTRVEKLFENPEDYLKHMESQKEDAINQIVSSYSSIKAGIIKRELAYIAENYKRQEDGESIYNENGYSEILDSQIPEVPYEKQKYLVDPYASKTVQMVQKILNYAEGEEFLKYASLVRHDSFNEGEFECTPDNFGYCFHAYDFTESAEKIEARASEEIESYIQSEYSMYKSDLAQAQKTIAGYQNLKYFVRKGDEVFTNIKSPQQGIASAKKQSFYLVKENGEYLLHSGTDVQKPQWVAELYDFDSHYEDCDEAVFYVGDNVVADRKDRIGRLYAEYRDLPQRVDLTVITAVVSLMLLLASVALLITCAGHKKGADGCVIAAVDKIPADLHFALSGGMIFGLFCSFVEIADNIDVLSRFFAVFSSVCCTVAFMLLVEFVTSMVRIKKAKKKIFANCIIIRLVTLIFKWITKFIKWSCRGTRKAFFSYKMKHLSKKLILIAVLWIAVNVAGIFFAVLGAYNDGVITIISSLLLLVFDGATIFFAAKYLNTLDKIIVAATEHTSANLYGERLPESLITLNESLKLTKAEMDEAVAKAVKNERTKAELITNVSHDLKTPLTSVISYVDLLKKCDIKDEDALKYIEVLSDKSHNLKNLIENLIEASKASTGNIRINKVYLNLKELAAQATGEFQSDFEARGLELRFQENDEEVRIFADGPHTYRVLENLLSNAKKYSAKGTRVYASIRREDNFGVFEIKNISKDPLNISPDELTERFVRGDASRGSEEGNGLGLSIAKQLCTLQGGELKLSIDGDLFKATVYLPIS